MKTIGVLNLLILFNCVKRILALDNFCPDPMDKNAIAVWLSTTHEAISRSAILRSLAMFFEDLDSSFNLPQDPTLSKMFQ